MKCEMYADKGEGIGLQYYEIKNDRPPLVLLHAQRQSFDTADNEPGIKCSQTGAGCFINQTQLVGNNRVLGYGEADEYIVMAAKIFCSAMDNYISAKVQRSLEIWCQEGIVDDNQKVIFVGNFADST